MSIVIKIAQSFELAPTKDLPDYTLKNSRLFQFPVKKISPRNSEELTMHSNIVK